MQFSTLFIAIVAFATVVVASPTGPISDRKAIENETTSSIISEAEMAHWLANTDAELTFIGQPPNPLAKRSAQSTSVMYCTKRVGSICGGTCTVYTGGATCLAAANTMCISATRDVGFCDEAGCNGNCAPLSLCGSPMGSGFCFTPQTMSILVSPL
ncbi:hypothetical protein BV20DRAFT_38332 [Pilatotrama ljubarskyi]|nr:hypothetical protein BV20DRAFT_38332 [Pilatotrama ljubarskyi]